MANRKQIYFVLNHEGKTLKLLSVLENRNQSLTIFPARAENYTEVEQGNNDADEPITNQKYSIHNSDNSEFGNNYIHHTINHPNGKTQESFIVTQALKNNGLHVPLFSARTQDLSNERYIINRKQKHNYVELGEYKPKKSTLYYMLIVSVSEPKINADDFNFKTLKFSRYFITIFWSFGLIPSHSTGNKTHFLTINDKNLQQHLSNGFQSIELTAHYKLHRHLQHVSFVNYIVKTYKTAQNSKLIKSLGFKKDASASIDKGDINNLLFINATNSFLYGQHLEKTNKIEKALEAYNNSLGLFSKLKLSIEVGNVKNSIATILQESGKVEDALKTFEELIELYSKNNLPFELARTYLNKSIVYRDMGKPSNAIESAQKALEISTTNKQITLLPEIQHELGVLFRHIGEIVKAKQALESANSNFKQAENPIGYAFCIANLGHIAHQEAQLQDALDCFTEALEIFKSNNHVRGVANEKANIGNILCSMGDTKKGLQSLTEALELHKKIGYEYAIATDLKLIGINSLDTSIELGIKKLNQSIEILVRIKNDREAEVLSQLVKEIKKTANII
ncbi:tetratricopeptide repeat protein [Marivirga sp. S37H4]|uniref:Tetratricopeptide repeat protein n=1 Tax=Marivirga aurantiaca TaxID=2802615 RepID=A0A934WZD1_9BACT|nr:tetratricopeptide repeat protein [Marivirga aurantiaca]MBK6265642.1 tetratricopeptide repeat protein [Marivirga aurantiaca]